MEQEPGDEMARKKGAAVQAFSGERMSRIRRREEITQLSLAVTIGVTPGTIGNWEAGRQVPGADDLAKLAAALGVGIEELFE